MAGGVPCPVAGLSEANSRAISLHHRIRRVDARTVYRRRRRERSPDSDRRRTVASRRHLSHRLCPGNEAISVAHLAIIARSHRRRPAAYLAL